VKLADYVDKYESVRLSRSPEGVLTVQLHTDGHELVWGFGPKSELAHLFADVGGDPDNKVIVLTGTGGEFIHREHLPASGDRLDPERWGTVNHFEGKKLLMNHLEIQAPMIAAVNGPATIHAEMALLCDIVVASEDAYFQDRPHFTKGLVPGDGVQLIWPLLLGLNRARYFLITGQKLSAQQALELGVVGEVVDRSSLLDRCYALAADILKQPPLTVRLTREAILQPIKTAFLSSLGYGLALEGLGAAAHWPFGSE
jgi:enoyl-CoA hydratase/carnithine racemase